MTHPTAVFLVGYGRIARASHIPALREYPEHFAVQGVVDTDPLARQAAREDFGEHVSLHPDLRSLLTELGHPDRPLPHASGKILWVICTPSGLHASQAADIAMERPSDMILVEKPVDTRLRSVDGLIHCLEMRPNVQCYVVKQNRFNPGVQLLHRALQSGRMGRIYSISSTVHWNRDDDYYRQAPWRGTWRHDGGALLNQAVHYVDLMRWLGGAVERVSAETMTLARKIEAEDTGAAILRFRSGALGVLQATVLTPGGNLEGSLTVVAEHGVVKLGGTALNRIETWRLAAPRAGAMAPDDVAMDEAAATLAATENPKSVYGSGHSKVYGHIASGGADKYLASPQEARHALEIVLGAYESAREGHAVSLPLAPDPMRRRR